MRILIVTEHFWPETFRITDLAIGLQDLGHHVEVLTGIPNYPAGSYFEGYGALGPFVERYRGIRILRVPIVPRGNGKPIRLALNYGSYVLSASLRALAWGFQRRWDISLVFQTSPVTQIIPALMLRQCSGVPAAVWVQDIWPEVVTASGLVRSPLVCDAIRWMSHRLYLSSDVLLGSSEAFVKRLRTIGIDQERLEYLPNWAEDIFLAQPEPVTASYGWEDGFPVMFAGNLGRVQGLDTLLRAAEVLKNEEHIHWVIVGDGSERVWMESEVVRRGLSSRVVMLGRKPVADMPGLFSKAGAMLVSLAPDDVVALTIPSKLQTYLAAGRPVLGSIDGEGHRVIVESGAGFVAPSGDAPGLAHIVKRMAALSQEERTSMGQRGREYYARHFARDSCIRRLEATLLRYASRSRG